MASLGYRETNTNLPHEVRWRQSGSQRRRGFRLKKDAVAWLKQARKIEEHERLGLLVAPSYIKYRTLDEQWEVWKASRVDKAKATRDKQAGAYRKWLSPALGKRMLGSLTHHDLTAVLAAATKAGRGPSTRITIYSTLNMILDDALGPDGHPCRRAVAGTDRRKREPRLLSDEELDLLLDVILPQKWRLLVETLATMGLRPHEAIGLRREDAAEGRLTVRSRKGNNYKTRVLPVPESLRQPLSDLAAATEPGGKLWPVPDWRVWRRRVWKPAVEAARLDGLIPYDLRHLCASRLIAAGATPTDVSTWMGHSVIMTLRTYSHLFEGRLDELADLLDRRTKPVGADSHEPPKSIRADPVREERRQLIEARLAALD